jgi:hypothetical protein
VKKLAIGIFSSLILTYRELLSFNILFWQNFAQMRKIEAHIRKEPESDIVYVKVNKNYKKKLEDGLRNKTSALIKVDKFFYIILALP